MARTATASSSTTVVFTAAKVSYIAKTAELSQVRETQVHSDTGYTGVEKRVKITALKRGIDWRIAVKRGRIKAMEDGLEKESLKSAEKAKAR